MRLASLVVRSAILAVILVASRSVVVHAQAAAAAKPAHTPVCAQGVRVYHDKADIKAAYDTLTMPPGAPIRVTSPEEAEAAEMLTRQRAGSVGANGILVTTEEHDEGDGNVRMVRNIRAVFVPTDSTR